MTEAAQQLNPRIIPGFVMGGIVTVCAILGNWVWTSLAILAYVIGYHEMLSIMANRDIYPSKFTVVLFCPLFYAFAFVGWQHHFDIIINAGVIFTFCWLLFRKKLASISDIGGTILIIFYLGLLPAHFILVRQLGHDGHVAFWQESGLYYLFLILFTVSASDIAAYYTGKRFGKNLLSPHISPKKTIEGSVGGIFAGIGIATLWCSFMHLSYIHGIALGLILSILGQLGDLSESLLKRDAGVKDSGTIIPGHGGLLDRTDSYIFSGAVAYYYINWFILHQGFAVNILEYLHHTP